MPADPTPTWAMIAGGGTAGHVIPGLSVAAELVRRGHSPDSIHFLGSARGVEVEMVPEAGFAVSVLPGRGLNSRRLDLANLVAVVGLVRATLAGIGIVRRHRPAVVLSLGGYAAVAGIIGAAVWRVPVVVTEQNARGSLANRLAGRFAKTCAVPFEGTDLPRAVVTGNPVRPEIVEAADAAADPTRRSAIRRELGVPEGSTLIAVMSGSLGARSVNRAAIAMVERLADRGDLVVHHVVGRRDWQSEHAPAPVLGAEAAIDHRSFEYESRADRLLAAADLFIGRAGGSTVAELAVVGVPSILVPLPIAPRDAQFHNAEALVQAGAAIRITDAECTGERLVELVEELLDDPATLPAMAASARQVGHADAAGRVAALCEEHALGD
ncbi:MAG: UDP-N-acetylglucosamine--N-acetylmuramyl-(pentapeptide) pyrophosphoryl-undecaprenol N-acetylglucosamine transferase [Acidimicrobiales bacterium]|nr:UDP-N-acetylglucosamine--N-acetylmuramyl-(pentapeptide) pyrophosphoryl-undecaprenol N-acetylglucosamine transferase [Acidimicrobiales bacterium]